MLVTSLVSSECETVSVCQAGSRMQYLNTLYKSRSSLSDKLLDGRRGKSLEEMVACAARVQAKRLERYREKKAHSELYSKFEGPDSVMDVVAKAIDGGGCKQQQ